MKKYFIRGIIKYLSHFQKANDLKKTCVIALFLRKLTLGEKEKYMVHRFGVAYDNVFYDAVIKGVDVSGVKKEDL